MTIAEVRDKCKSIVAKAPRDMLIVGILILASSMSFGLGYLAGKDSVDSASELPQRSQGSPVILESSTKGQVVASKNGTKYYFPSCAGADRITEANKVWFISAAAAAAAGYTPAANCKGL